VLLLSIALVLLLTPFLLLAIPVELFIDYDSQAKIKLRARVVWFFGLVNIKHSNKPKSKQQTKTKSEKTKFDSKSNKNKTPKKSRQKKNPFLWTALTSEGFVQRLVRLIYDILTTAKIKTFFARIYFGMDDPADTGRIYGIGAPLFSVFYAIPQLDFEAIPVFDEEIFRGQLKTHVHVVPINYVKVILLFLFSRELWRTVYRIIKVKFK